MPTVKYVKHDGSEQEVEIVVGESVMQAAVDNMIEGIIGECCGCCSCATCHCYVDESWFEKVGEPNEIEQGMLKFAQDLKTTSRLSCQILMTDELDGLVVHLPESQGSY